MLSRKNIKSQINTFLKRVLKLATKKNLIIAGIIVVVALALILGLTLGLKKTQTSINNQNTRDSTPQEPTQSSPIPHPTTANTITNLTSTTTEIILPQPISLNKEISTINLTNFIISDNTVNITKTILTAYNNNNEVLNLTYKNGIINLNLFNSELPLYSTSDITNNEVYFVIITITNNEFNDNIKVTLVNLNNNVEKELSIGSNPLINSQVITRVVLGDTQSVSNTNEVFRINYSSIN